LEGDNKPLQRSEIILRLKYDFNNDELPLMDFQDHIVSEMASQTPELGFENE